MGNAPFTGKMRMDVKRCFKILEIRETDAADEIKRAYRDLITIWHPDRYAHHPRLQKKATEKVKELNAAYHCLMAHLSRPKPAVTLKNAGARGPSSPVSVICPGCRTLNRLQADAWVRQRKCVYCNHPLLAEDPGSAQQEDAAASVRGYRTSPGAKGRRGVRWVLLAAAVGAACWYGYGAYVERAGLPRQTTRVGGPRALQPGDLWAGREQALEIQRFLRQLGYDAGAKNGPPGQGAVEAVNRFRADFGVPFADGRGDRLLSALKRHAAIARRHSDWPMIQQSAAFDRWIEEQALTAPEICRRIAASGAAEQVASMLDAFKFDQTRPDPRPLPRNGVMHRRFAKGLAPLTIETRLDGRHYYVKLIREADGSEALTAFVKSGATLTEHVPVGTYRLKYAVGDKWYGEKWLFGGETVFHVMDQALEFKLKGSEIMGYRFKLYSKPLGRAKAHKTYAFDF